MSERRSLLYSRCGQSRSKVGAGSLPVAQTGECMITNGPKVRPSRRPSCTCLPNQRFACSQISGSSPSVGIQFNMSNSVREPYIHCWHGKINNLGPYLTYYEGHPH